MNAIALHIAISSLALALSLAAAAWLRPITARTRHAILMTGLASLFVPPALIAYAVEHFAPAARPLQNVLPLLRAPLAVANTHAAEPSRLPQILIALWASVAVLLFVRWSLVARRLIVTATRAAAPPPERAVRLLATARERLGIRQSIDIVVSPICEAPAVLRVLRPVIILPTDGCATLDDDELQSLLCHECAHVARRDNLLGAFQVIACSLFWFNPLVWLTHRRIAAAREQACDERARDAAPCAETYVAALAKVCRGLVAPPVAGVSCMASAHLQERMEHLMRYDTIRTSALSHRLISAISAAAVAMVIFAAGAVTAAPVRKSIERYGLDYSVQRTSNGTYVVRTKILGIDTGSRVKDATLEAKAGEAATLDITCDSHRFRVHFTPPASGAGKLQLTAWDGTTQVQDTTYDVAIVETTRTTDVAWKGEPISLDLSNADIRDVLRTFSQLTGVKMEVASDVATQVTVHWVDKPWDQALDELLRDNGLTYSTDAAKVMHIARAK
ncbi:MAG TPA: M56 family metallopeptidase [Thermoanaerobaculia bacterium]|nr:M56 family metallopeptidase [Thermoanaerobaculia bacterium]